MIIEDAEAIRQRMHEIQAIGSVRRCSEPLWCTKCLSPRMYPLVCDAEPCPLKEQPVPSALFRCTR